MASNKVPKHDFAPPWLKIPDQENGKPGGRSSDGDSKGGRGGWRDEYYYGRYPPPPDYPFHPLQRQRSFDYYEDRRFPAHKMRHHSVDDDYHNNSYGGYGYYNGYSYDKYGPHYRSQPLYRDSKYQHPNAGARYNQVPPGMYPPYYDPYYDYYHGDPYYNQARNGQGKRYFSESRSGFKSEKSNGKDSKAHTPAGSTDKVNGVANSQESNGGTGVEAGSKDVNCNGDMKSLAGKAIGSNTANKSSPTLVKKDGSATEEEKRLVNGVSKLSVSPNDSMLSSSLEAEQRLLREMGWNEADEEEYEITEDDMKEFQNLTKHMKEKRNGLMRTLPKTWSPQHNLTKYEPAVQDGVDESSSDSDSDMD